MIESEPGSGTRSYAIAIGGELQADLYELSHPVLCDRLKQQPNSRPVFPERLVVPEASKLRNAMVWSRRIMTTEGHWVLFDRSDPESFPPPDVEVIVETESDQTFIATFIQKSTDFSLRYALWGN
jgi:hypothetical protein